MGMLYRITIDTGETRDVDLSVAEDRGNIQLCEFEDYDDPDMRDGVGYGNDEIGRRMIVHVASLEDPDKSWGDGERLSTEDWYADIVSPLAGLYM